MELEEKLNEEVKEYLEDKSLEEMADVLEVLYSICSARGYTKAELEAERKKRQKTGADLITEFFWNMWMSK